MPDSNCIPCGIRSAAIRVSRRSLIPLLQNDHLSRNHAGASAKAGQLTRAERSQQVNSCDESEDILRRAEAAQCVQGCSRVCRCRLAFDSGRNPGFFRSWKFRIGLFTWLARRSLLQELARQTRFTRSVMNEGRCFFSLGQMGNFFRPSCR